MELEKAFDTLGVDESASSEDIKRAYRQKAKESHTDINPERKKEFLAVSDAYRAITTFDKMRSKLISDFRNNLNIQEKKIQIIDNYSLNLLKKKNSIIEEIWNDRNFQMRLILFSSIPILIIILALTQSVFSLTLYTIIVFGICITVILIITISIIDLRNSWIREMENHFEISLKILINQLRSLEKMQYIHFRLKAEFTRQRRPLTEEAVLEIIKNSIDAKVKSELENITKYISEGNFIQDLGNAQTLYSRKYLEILILNDIVKKTDKNSYLVN